ncbi:uncharacterized protein L3040_002277 [Drepanopeziza brunnea f. sp. 'multigermtubi']|uniref:Uncharacterized protein n=1 Tax=Marssonina brunnea f. sp. multigermtubi (strain MB_m1) TaxID=1072389 RepID=K1WQY4_MARBU|nr:uncharacterized protein MBM_01997 [Drepanopeziza brunnea f. sp. 'multigermtubi' MB_m1]EKD20045.1 hypothetical protein MBM_01997 [Drepanopeziza brunnea f. sp. 'multigermtubi' MB_m1]KAJ5050394.1 hypothetical protein L3040_002277 [Drepanopeziza brunnea f. sp. 'multigermtubi']
MATGPATRAKSNKSNERPFGVSSTDLNRALNVYTPSRSLPPQYQERLRALNQRNKVILKTTPIIRTQSSTGADCHDTPYPSPDKHPDIERRDDEPPANPCDKYSAEPDACSSRRLEGEHNSPPLFLSQESQPLEDYIRKSRRLRASGSEQELPLDQFELELLRMGDGDEADSIPSATLFPKRLQDSDSRRSRQNTHGGSQYINEGSNQDPDQEAPPPKKWQKRRGVASVGTYNANIQELKGVRVTKAGETDKRPSFQKSKKSHDSNDKNSTSQRASLKIKQPRRVPAGELVIAEARLEESDPELSSNPPLELSQDPTSQIRGSDTDDDDDDRPDTRREPAFLTMKIKPRKRIGCIDTSKFKMPKPRLLDQPKRIPSYSDGFDGKEGEPIGRLMPVKQSFRRKQNGFRMTIKFGTLQLVSEKPEEEQSEKPRPRRKKKKKVPDNHDQTRKNAANVEPEDDQMILDIQAWEPENRQEVNHPQASGNAPSENVAQDPKTPTATTNQSNISSTPTGHTSPLKRKSQGKLRASSINGGPQLEPQNVSRQSDVERQKDTKFLEPSKPASLPERSQQQIQDDLIVSQEISQVTMKRPSVDNTGEGHHVGGYDDHANGARDYEEEEESSDKPCLTPSPSPPEDEEMDAKDEPKTLSPSITFLHHDNQISSQESGSVDDEETGEFIGQDDNIFVAEDSAVSQEEEMTGSLLPTVREMEELTKKMVMELNQETESVLAKQRKSRLPSKHQASGMALASKKTSRLSQMSQSAFKTPIKVVHLPEISNRKHVMPKCQQQEPPTSDGPDSSWRPRVPNTRGAEMEEQEEIVDIQTPSPVRKQVENDRRRSLRKRSTSIRQPLRTAKDRPESQIMTQDILPAITHDSQGGSLELGSTQKFVARRSFASEIPETQVENQPEEQAKHTVLVPENSYFSQASQHLSESAQRASHTLSMPVRVHFAHQLKEEEHGERMMAESVTYSAAFQHTASSPTKTPTSSRPSIMHPQSSQTSLKDLTRKASLGMGTVLSKKRRLTSINSLLSQFR